MHKSKTKNQKQKQNQSNNMSWLSNLPESVLEIILRGSDYITVTTIEQAKILVEIIPYSWILIKAPTAEEDGLDVSMLAELLNESTGPRKIILRFEKDSAMSQVELMDVLFF